MFFDQQSVQAGSKSRPQYDALLELPLSALALDASAAYTVHVNVHARFLSPRKGGVAPGDLFVGVSDGARVAGVVRHTASAAAAAWATPVSAAVGERELAADSVVLARKAAGRCADERACAAGAESFEVLFSLGQRTSVAAVARGNHAAQLGAAGIELADDLRQAGALSVVLHAGGWDHAFEIAAVEVRVTRVASGSAPSLAAFASVDEFVTRATTERFSNLWPAFALLDADNKPAVRGASFASDRARALAADGCGVAFETAEPVPGIAYSELLDMPVVGAGQLRRDRQYVLHVAVTADATSPRNSLFVGIADGLESGAHVVGFARADRQSDALGQAIGGVLARNHDQLQFETRQFTAIDGGARAGDNAVPAHFTVDIVIGAGSTRVLANGARGGKPLDAFIDTDLYGLDVTAALSLVVMQRGERTRESTTLRLLSVTIDEVRVGCDGIPNSGKKLDACGVCGGNDACVGCDGVPLSGKLLDACGVCGGDSSACADCAGVPHGPARVDACGVCGGSDACLAGKSLNAAAAFKQRAAQRYASGNNDNNDNAHEHDKRATLGQTPNTSVKDAVDCAGRLKREGGSAVYDLCGVCGGDNECVGCDGRPFGGKYDACGVCNGDNSTCCVNYCDVPNDYWNFLLLPVTLDNLIDQIELTRGVLVYLRDKLPNADTIDKQGINELQAGRMAEFNRVFLADCLVDFCIESGQLYKALVADNNPLRVIAAKRSLELAHI